MAGLVSMREVEKKRRGEEEKKRRREEEKKRRREEKRKRRREGRREKKEERREKSREKREEKKASQPSFTPQNICFSLNNHLDFLTGERSIEPESRRNSACSRPFLKTRNKVPTR